MKRGVKIVRTDTRGFFANYITTLNQCLTLEEIDLVPVIDYTTGFNEYRNAEHQDINIWKLYFKYEQPNCEIIDIWNWSLDRFTKKYHRPKLYFSGGGIQDGFEHTNIFDYRSIIDRLFKPHPSIITDLNNILSTYNLDVSNCIGVCYRGTDKDTECTRVSYTKVIEIINSILEKDPDVKIYVQTDEIEFLDYVNRIYNNKCISINEFLISSRKINVPVHMLNEMINGRLVRDDVPSELINHHKFKVLRGRSKTGYQLGKDCMVMMLLLSKCKYLIKTPSGLSSVSCLYRDKGMENVFLI